MSRFDWFWNLIGCGPEKKPVSEPIQQITQVAPKPNGPMTSDYKWNNLNQIKMHVQVQKAIDLIRANPRPIEQLDLSEWKVIDGPPRIVQHIGGMFRPFEFDNLPERTSEFPVLVGQANGKKFVFDGAHRTAQGVLLKKKSINAVVFTEEETRSFIRPGFEAKFNKAVGIKP